MDREEWEAAYCAAFRRIARERGWTEGNIESGWLDEWPHAAWLALGTDGVAPDEVAQVDVQAAEMEAV